MSRLRRPRTRPAGSIRVIPVPRLVPPTHNLPALVSSFVGRGRELAELRRLLAGTRLLTLAGPGGIGKTRLALALAQMILSDFVDGVWLVELGSLTDPALVARAVATTLRVGEEAGVALIDALAEGLRAQHLLLILDNCEHVLAACAELIQQLLQACPELCILTTGREPLGMTGETIWRVPGLALGDSDMSPAQAPPDASEAVQLLVARAGAASSTFALTEKNAKAVDELCRNLEGIPLAIELAAARLKMLAPEQVATRLSDQLQLLTGGSRTAPARQKTLLATLDWSYDLLPEPARRLFNRLGVFAGGFTLEGVEGVCAGEGIRRAEILDLLERLVDKSLVLVEAHSEGEARYRLLEPIRQYARRRLIACAEMVVIQERHAAYFLALAEREVPALEGPDPRLARLRLERDHDNLRVTLSWLIEQNDVERAWRLGEHLCTFWYLHLHTGEGRMWVTRLLKLEGDDLVPMRVALLHGAGPLAWAAGDLTLLQELGEQSVAISRERYPTGLPFSLWLLGLAKMVQGDYAAARALNGEGLAASRAAGKRIHEVLHLIHLSALAKNTGDFGQARSLAVEARLIAEDVGYTRGAASALTHLGSVCYFEGDYSAARSCFEESLRTLNALGQSIEAGLVQNGVGLVAVEEGDLLSARSWLRDALSTGLAGRGDAGPVGHFDVVLRSLDGFTVLAAACRQSERALRMAAAIASRRQRTGLVLEHPQMSVIEKHLEAARAHLSQDAVMAAEHAGQAMTLQQLIADALNLECTGLDELDVQHSPLTARQQEVAALIARGLSNRQIAEELVIAEYTAERHVHHILTKLGLTSRTQVAAWAFEHTAARHV